MNINVQKIRMSQRKHQDRITNFSFNMCIEELEDNKYNMNKDLRRAPSASATSTLRRHMQRRNLNMATSDKCSKNLVHQYLQNDGLQGPCL